MSMRLAVDTASCSASPSARPAAIAAGLALGFEVQDAVSAAKQMLGDALLNRSSLGPGLEALDLFWQVGQRGTVMTL